MLPLKLCTVAVATEEWPSSLIIRFIHYIIHYLTQLGLMRDFTFYVVQLC